MADKTSGAAKAVAKKSGAATTVAKQAGDNLSPATETAASGALIEPEIAAASVIEHPALDTHPRSGTPATSNQIDLNDPTLTPEQAVVKNLTGELPEDDDAAPAEKAG